VKTALCGVPILYQFSLVNINAMDVADMAGGGWPARIKHQIPASQLQPGLAESLHTATISGGCTIMWRKLAGENRLAVMKAMQL